MSRNFDSPIEIGFCGSTPEPKAPTVEGEPTLCSNCNKPYAEHEQGTLVCIGSGAESRWFPKAIASVISSAKPLRPHQCPTCGSMTKNHRNLLSLGGSDLDYDCNNAWHGASAPKAVEPQVDSPADARKLALWDAAAIAETLWREDDNRWNRCIRQYRDEIQKLVNSPSPSSAVVKPALQPDWIDNPMAPSEEELRSYAKSFSVVKPVEEATPEVEICPKCNHPHYNMEDSEFCRSMNDDETPCLKREDGQHCNCWYDGNSCCACGDGPSKPAPTEETKHEFPLPGKSYYSNSGAVLVPRIVDTSKGSVLYTNSLSSDIHELSLSKWLEISQFPKPEPVEEVELPALSELAREKCGENDYVRAYRDRSAQLKQALTKIAELERNAAKGAK